MPLTPEGLLQSGGSKNLSLDPDSGSQGTYQFEFVYIPNSAWKERKQTSASSKSQKLQLTKIKGGLKGLSFLLKTGPIPYQMISLLRIHQILIHHVLSSPRPPLCSWKFIIQRLVWDLIYAAIAFAPISSPLHRLTANLKPTTGHLTTQLATKISRWVLCRSPFERDCQELRTEIHAGAVEPMESAQKLSMSLQELAEDHHLFSSTQKSL